MSVAGPNARMEPLLNQVTVAVMEAAAAVSRRLGYRGPGRL